MNVSLTKYSGQILILSYQNTIPKTFAFTEVLGKHAPMKNKYMRANQSDLMSKNLIKATMRKLTTSFKKKTENSREVYNMQRNYCSSGKEK